MRLSEMSGQMYSVYSKLCNRAVKEGGCGKCVHFLSSIFFFLSPKCLLFLQKKTHDDKKAIELCTHSHAHSQFFVYF